MSGKAPSRAKPAAAVLAVTAAVVGAGSLLPGRGPLGTGSAQAAEQRLLALTPGDAVLGCAGPPRLPSLEGTPGADEGFAAVAETASGVRAVALAGERVPALTLEPALEPADGSGPGAKVPGTASGSLVVASASGAGQHVASAAPVEAAASEPAQPAAAAAVQSAVTPAGDLRGLAASSCTVPGADLWLVGGATVVGSSARLDLLNPGRTAATVDLTLLTASGTSSPPAGRGIALAPGERREVLLDGLAPGAASLGVRVEAAGGDVAASVVSTALRGLTPAGVETVVPGAAPSRTLVVPGVVVREGAAAPVLRLAAPGTEDAVVRWRLLGTSGQVAAAGSVAETVPAGTVLDVPLEGVPPGDYALAVDADVPVAAAAASSSGDGRGPTDVAWSASAAPLGGKVPVALPAGDVSARLVLAADDAAVPVDVRAIADDGSVAGTLRVPVASGATATVDVDELAADGAAALVLSVPDDAAGVYAGVDLTASADAGPALTSALAVLPPAEPAGSVTVVQSSRW